MIDAYVLGRPMPRSSSALVSAASLKRAGGWVVWPLAFELDALERFADRHARQHLFLVGQLGIGIVGAFDVRPQVAGEVDRLAADLEDAAVAFDRDRDPPGRGSRPSGWRSCASKSGRTA